MEANPELADIAVKLHEYGNNVVKEIGGRVVHVVTAVPGGMTRGLTGEARYKLLRESRAAMSNAQKLVDAIFNLFETREKDPAEYAGVPTNYMGLVSDGDYEIYDGPVRIKKPSGETITEMPPQKYLDYFQESTSDHSFTKIPYLKSLGLPDGLGRVGPLARTNVIDGYKWPQSERYFDWYKKLYDVPSHDTAAYNLARTVEFMAAMEEVIEGLSDDRITSMDTRVPVKTRAGNGVGIVEAPRGILLHNYRTNDKGILEYVNIKAPTTYNHLNIENNLKNWAAVNSEKISHENSRDEALWGLEKIVRAYDPCLSCSVHMVEVKLKIDGVYTPVRRLY
jgi:F420-non-reducing hydrogenase large subunit